MVLTEIFTSGAVLDAVILTVIGLVLYNAIGWLKSPDKFNLRLAASSALIAFVLSVPVVITELSVIDLEGAGEAVAAIVVFGLIAQVAGIEKTVKNAKAVIVGKLKKT